MKIKPQILITCLFILLFLSSCFEDSVDHHYHIPFQNNSNHSVYVDRSSKEQYLMSPHFQDTILQEYYVDPSHDSASFLIKPGETNVAALFNWGAYEYEFGYAFDTLLVFVFNADTLEIKGWDYVRENYKVEQRYDLSLEDLKNIDFKLSFPPTEAMKHIHMWPPYGTYDKNGRRKEKKH